MKKTLLFLALTPFWLTACGDSTDFNDIKKIEQELEDKSSKSSESYKSIRQIANNKDLSAEQKVEQLEKMYVSCDEYEQAFYQWVGNGFKGSTNTNFTRPYFCSEILDTLNTLKTNIQGGLSDRIVYKVYSDVKRDIELKRLEAIWKPYQGLDWKQSIKQLAKDNYNDSDLEVETRLDYIIRDKDEIIGHILRSDGSSSAINRWALGYIYYNVLQQAREELGKVSYPELRQNKSFCKTDRRALSQCGIVERIIRERREDFIQEYSKNFDQIKKDFNQCFANSSSRDDYNHWAAYPCSESKEALEKLGFSTDSQLD